MKKVSFCLMLFAGTAINIHGQEMSEFAPLGAEWWYSGYRYLTEEEPLPEVYVAEKYVHYKSSEAVFFAGKNCRRIDKTIYTRNNTDISFTEQELSPEYVYNNADTVFFYDILSEGFVPMYIFNAVAGDTLSFRIPSNEDELSYPLMEEVSVFKVVVDSMTSITIDEHELKVIALGDLVDATSGVTFSGNGSFENINSTAGAYIQRLGAPLCGFLPPTVPATTPDHTLPKLLCYTDGDISYTYDGNPCIFPDGVTAVQDIDPTDIGVRVYPNPASGYIYIDNTSQSNKPIACSILDMTGRKVTGFYLDKDRTSYDIAVLPAGMYLLQLNIKGQPYFKKIVKQ